MDQTSSYFFVVDQLQTFMDKNFLLSLSANKDLILSVNLIKRRESPIYAIFYFRSQSDRDKVLLELKDKDIDKFINYKLSISEMLPNVSPINTPDSEFKFHIAYEKLIETEYTISLKEPGLVYLNQDIVNRYSKAIKSLIKTIGTNIIKGRSIMNISLPVIIFDKRSLLQVPAYEFSFAPYFLERAAICTDPLERLKWTGVFLFSQLHLSPLQTKPFNPILGETFQFEIGLNTKVYLEQTVNKPPTSNFLVYGKNYTSYGYVITEASTGANSITAKKSGTFVVKFNDGNIHKFYFPTIGIKGLTMGKRTFNYKHCSIVHDEKSGMAFFLRFNPDEKGTLGKLFFSQKSTPDTARHIIYNFRGQITNFADIQFEATGKHTLKKNAMNYGVIEGQWTKSLTIDGVKYWDRDDYPLANYYNSPFILPSDSTYRVDLNYFIKNDEVEAQSWKEKMEEIQRYDRKLRENYQKGGK